MPSWIWPTSTGYATNSANVTLAWSRLGFVPVAQTSSNWRAA